MPDAATVVAGANAGVGAAGAGSSGSSANAGTGQAIPVAQAGQAAAASAPASTPSTLIGGEPSKAPDKYEIKLKDGVPTYAKATERISAYAKANGLSNDAAQAMAEFHHEGIGEYLAEQQAEFQKHRDKWFEEVKADKEMGGDKFEANAQMVKNFAMKELSKETREFLNESGFGNNPHLFRDLLKLAKRSAPDKLVTGQTTTATKAKSDVEKLFPLSVGGGDKTE